MISRNVDFFVVFFVLLAMLVINHVSSSRRFGFQPLRPVVTVIRSTVTSPDQD